MSFFKSYNFFHQSGATGAAVQIKTGPGVLHSVVSNTVGATPSVITLGDGTTAASTTFVSLLQTAGTTAVPMTALYDVRFVTGLVLNGVGAGQDITVVYE